MTLTDLFTDADYGFRFRFERSEPGEFFRPTPEHRVLISQRSHWLETDPSRYAALLPQGTVLLDETVEFARRQGIVSPDSTDLHDAFQAARKRCLSLGRTWEPDFLLLALEPDDTVRLVGGCVCFPSSWSLEEKMGHPIETIHRIVPGLNAALGAQIHGFLAKLRPGAAWRRSNWGLSRTAELNQHPARRLPRLDDTIRLDEVWLRVEHQALLALPRSKGILFGIRLALHPLAEICADRALASRLVRALATMPEAMARYKGLATARERLIALLTTANHM
jgi:hypothetical protein